MKKLIISTAFMIACTLTQNAYSAPETVAEKCFPPFPKWPQCAEECVKKGLVPLKNKKAANLVPMVDPCPGGNSFFCICIEK